jgi:hypothetical protein
VPESIALMENIIHCVAGDGVIVWASMLWVVEQKKDNRRQLLPLILPVVTPRFIPTCRP